MSPHFILLLHPSKKKKEFRTTFRLLKIPGLLIRQNIDDLFLSPLMLTAIKRRLEWRERGMKIRVMKTGREIQSFLFSLDWLEGEPFSQSSPFEYHFPESEPEPFPRFLPISSKYHVIIISFFITSTNSLIPSFLHPFRSYIHTQSSLLWIPESTPNHSTWFNP